MQFNNFMRKKIYSIPRRFINKLYEKAKDAEYQYIPLGIIGFVSFIAYYFIWHTVAPNEYQNDYLRLIGATLCFFLMFKKYWPNSLRPILPLWWYATLLYCFPIFFTFMLFKNPDSNVWLLTTMTGVFYLILLVDLVDVLVLIVLGTAISWVCYVLTTHPIVTPYLFLQTLPTYATVIVAGKIFIHRTSTIQNEKLKAMRSMGASVAHELRTPLSAVAMGLDGIKEYLPTLIETYITAKQQGLVKKPIPRSHFELLESLLDDLLSEASYSNIIVDMILMNVKQNTLITSNYKKIQINPCVKEAIRRYPFKNNQDNLVEWDSTYDFVFEGDKVLMEHVLFNLLKNSLYYIEAAKKGNIVIWAENKGNRNVLHFKDTASGIPRSAIPLIFDRFYTTTVNGTGLGLAFCKMVMNSMGGTISCTSEYGEYTQFDLEFLKVDS